MYLNFACSCYIEIKNQPKGWETFLKDSNWCYHNIENPGSVDLNIDFVPKMPFLIQKRLHPKFGACDEYFIIYDKNKRCIAFNFSKIGEEPALVLVEEKFDLNSLEDLLFNFIKIILLGKNIACIHASSYLTKKGAKVIAGWEGIGKSSIMLKKVYEGDSFLSDDRTFISKEGFVFPIYSDVKQYSGEFSSFKELLKHSNFSEKFIIKLNILLHKIRDNKNFSKFHYGIQKILNLLRRLHLYKVSIPLNKISIGENKKYSLADVLVVQNVISEDIVISGLETNEIITSLLSTTKYDDNEMFKLYQAYKYIFPKEQNKVLETYDQRVTAILKEGLSYANVSFCNALQRESIVGIVKNIGA